MQNDCKKEIKNIRWKVKTYGRNDKDMNNKSDKQSLGYSVELHEISSTNKQPSFITYYMLYCFIS